MLKSLYTDKNTEEDIEKLSETDSDSVIYNLYEDILILKEQLATELSINKTLHSLMISGEERGVQKATEEFKEQLASAKTPNMFWDAENPEECQFDVRDVFESYFCESTEVGLQVVIQQAVSVPNATYKLIELNNDGTFEIEKITNTTIDKE